MAATAWLSQPLGCATDVLVFCTFSSLFSYFNAMVLPMKRPTSSDSNHPPPVMPKGSSRHWSPFSGVVPQLPMGAPSGSSYLHVQPTNYHPCVETVPPTSPNELFAVHRSRKGPSGVYYQLMCCARKRTPEEPSMRSGHLGKGDWNQVRWVLRTKYKTPLSSHGVVFSFKFLTFLTSGMSHVTHEGSMDVRALPCEHLWDLPVVAMEICK